MSLIVFTILLSSINMDLRTRDDIDAHVTAKLHELLAAQAPAQFATTVGAIGSVAIKLQPFWTTRPEVWFAQCEAQFVTLDITNQLTKFYHVATALDTSLRLKWRS